MSQGGVKGKKKKKGGGGGVGRVQHNEHNDKQKNFSVICGRFPLTPRQISSTSRY